VLSCVHMELSPITAERQERARRGARKWNALRVLQPRTEAPAVVPEPRPQIPADRCQGDRSCPFPPLFQGRCRQHSLDLTAERSQIGVAHGMLREYGLLVEPEPPSVMHRRCRAKKKARSVDPSCASRRRSGVLGPEPEVSNPVGSGGTRCQRDGGEVLQPPAT
jgi:hypothetical protein